EAVCNPGGDIGDVLDTISSLVDKSLLKQQEDVRAPGGVGGHASGEPRFWMLETIREYGLERLEESGEAQQIRRQHAEFFLALCEEDEQFVLGLQDPVWLDRLEVEHENSTAALRWLVAQGDTQLALRLAAALMQFWVMRGYASEGRNWLEQVLSLPGAGERTPARAKALVAAASIAWPQGDLKAGRIWSEEGAAIFRELGDRQGLAYALAILAMPALLQGDLAAAAPIFEEALALSGELPNRRLVGLLLLAVGQMAMMQGDYPLARSRFEQALAESRASHNKWEVAQTLNSLGDLARLEGDYPKAVQLYEQSLAEFRNVNANGDIPAVLHNLGHASLARGDHKRARTLFAESLALQQELSNKAGVAEGLSGLAGIAAVESQASSEQGPAAQPEKALRAARLFGVSDALRAASGAPMWPAERADYERNIASARAQLDEQTWQKAWQEGHTMSLEAAIQYALQA
ncbi:MAG: tetratricopeptide repeat protein, partial [Chloroflexia bacterium]